MTLEEWQSASEAIRKPASHVRYDRWGNVVEITDPRNPDWRITCCYNAFDQKIEQSVMEIQS